MRVLFAHDLLDFRSGGAFTVIYNLLAKMDRRCFSNLVAVPGGPAPISDRFSELDASLHVLPEFARGLDGPLLPPGAGDELAACILRLAEDRDLSRERVKNGRETLMACFTDDAQARKVSDVFESLF